MIRSMHIAAIAVIAAFGVPAAADVASPAEGQRMPFLANAHRVAQVSTPAASRATTIDTHAPVLVAFTPAPQVDAGPATAREVFDITVADDLSGFLYGYIDIASPSGQQAEIAFGDGVPTRSAHVAAAMPFTPFAEPGTWSVTHVSLLDKNGNVADLDATAVAAIGPTHFVVTNANGDDTGLPVLLSGRVVTPSVSYTKPAPWTKDSPQWPVVEVHVQDTGTPTVSGLAFVSMVFCGPDGPCFSLSGGTDGRFGIADATLRATGSPPQGGFVGTYALEWIYVTDMAGNTAGFQSTLFGGTTDFTALFGSPPTLTLRH